MSAFRSLPARRLADVALLGLLAAVAFLLGCYEMGDSDVWWHLRGGEWVLAHGRAPGLDPFTFGSEDRAWVDVHWSYEVVLALAYRAGGVGALVLLGAGVGALAFLAALSARRREWPVAAAVLCWAPALVLFAFRLDPRPEIFSLLYIGGYLAVLWRAEDRPALAWLLPVVQVLWVNAQGLFALGPALLGLFVSAHAIRLVWDRYHGRLIWGPEPRRWWLHVGGAGCAVVLACLANPYFLDGALFPFALLPKVAREDNPYKTYIDELKSPARFVKDAGVAVAGANWFFLAHYLLLSLLPLSFLYPALWRAARAARPADDPATGRWLAGLAAVVGLLALSALTISDRGRPDSLVGLGDAVPLLLAAAGVGAAVALRRHGAAAWLAGVGGAALGAWVGWLRLSLLPEAGRVPFAPSSPATWLVLVVVSGVVAGALVLRWGGQLFRLLLAIAFAVMALQALQNWTRFALVAGLVLSWNFGEWTAQLTALRPAGRHDAALGWGLRAALACGLVLWGAALLGDRYYAHTGEPRHLAFREEPLVFAHEAAVFAGQPGLPDRALVYGLQQTGVYDWHNAPRCKPFMDGRLEMPDQATFTTYRRIEDWLRQGNPEWERAAAGMGDPLLLLEHQTYHDAEAHLFTNPRWRCVHYDAVASVFVRRDGHDDPARFPTVDFAARHFHEQAPPVPAVRRAAAREQQALFRVAAVLPPTPDAAWRWRIPVLLAALDRGRQALDEDAARPETWVMLGACCSRLDPDLRVPPPGPATGWGLERSLYLAQATWCYRRATEQQPDNAMAWFYLAQSYQLRGMVDAQVAAEERWVTNEPQATRQRREQMAQLHQQLAAERDPPAPPTVSELQVVVGQLLQRHRPEAAARVIEEAEGRGLTQWPWSFAERAAGLYMHLGRPADARRVWQRADGCPSEAVRECRLAGADWVERDFDGAVRHFRAARAADSELAEACWGLAMLHTQLGEAGPALEACRAGVELVHKGPQPADPDPTTRRRRADLEHLEVFLKAHQGR